MEEFKGETYIVVGATQGIGKSVAALLAQKGARLALVARNQGKLAELAESLPFGPHVPVAFDVCDVLDIAEKMEFMESGANFISGMVYCVGMGKTAKLRDLSPYDMECAMRGNCAAYVEFIRRLCRKKPKQRKLRIVGISSLASIDNEKYLTAYASSKAAMEAATRCLANELGGRNVRINVIRPGFVDTPRLNAINEIANGVEAKIMANGYQPLGLVPPDDVASLALYLLSDKAAFINGCCIPINGGAISQ